MNREKYLSLTIPISCLMEITDKCNLECSHCYLEHNRSDSLIWNDYHNILIDLVSLGCFNIILTGGEPFLRKELLFKIILEAKSMQFRINLITNMTLCTYNDIDFLAKHSIDKLAVSIYGFNKSIYKKMCKVDVEPENIFDKIRYAYKQGISINVQTCLSIYNYSDAEKIFNWCKKENIPLDFTYTFIGNEGRSKHNIECSLPLKDVEECMIFHKQDYLTYVSEKIHMKKNQFCSAGKRKLSIASDGTLFPCTNWRIPIGNVRNGLVNSWNNPNYTLHQIRSYNFFEFSCSKCDKINICAFCPGMNFSENNSPYIPSKEVCKFTQALLNIYEKAKREEGEALISALLESETNVQVLDI